MEPMDIGSSNEKNGLLDGNSEFSDRIGFIRKVYSILSVQLCLTASAITAVKLNDEWNDTMKSPAMGGLAIGLLILSVCIECAILCCKSVARKTPTNYILLFIFTACQAFVFAVICSFYTASSCIAAAGMTAAVTIALTIYACTTKTDFTMCGGLFFIMGIALLCLCMFSFFMTFAEWWHPVLSAILVVFYGLYLIYDTQLIAGGRKHQLSIDDYIVGALLLYVDIMMLFLELLKLFGDRN